MDPEAKAEEKRIAKEQNESKAREKAEQAERKKKGKAEQAERKKIEKAEQAERKKKEKEQMKKAKAASREAAKVEGASAQDEDSVSQFVGSESNHIAAPEERAAKKKGSGKQWVPRFTSAKVAPKPSSSNEVSSESKKPEGEDQEKDNEEDSESGGADEGSLNSILGMLDLDGDGKVGMDEAMTIAKAVLKEVCTSEHYAALREGFLYLVFLLVFLFASLLASGGADAQYMKVKFSYTERMRELLIGAEFRPSDVPNFKKTFNDILTPEDAWYFLEGPLLSVLYPGAWYNGDPLTREENAMVLNYNRVLGGARIRQLRVEPDSCVHGVRDIHQSKIKWCYGPLSDEYEHMTGFGPISNVDLVSTTSAFVMAERMYKQSQDEQWALQVPPVPFNTTCGARCGRFCIDKFRLDAHLYAEKCGSQCSHFCHCEKHQALKNKSSTLYDATCDEPMGLAGRAIPSNDYKHKWHNADDLDELPYYGRVQMYPGSGYVVDLPLNGSQAMERILQLKQERFIDLGTRAIFIDFTVYNAHLKLYNVIRLCLEFPQTGGILPHAVYRPVNIDMYDNGVNLVAFLEIILVFFVVGFFMQEVYELAYLGLPYFTHFWNFLDILNLGIFIVVICFRLYTVDMVYGFLGVAKLLPEITTNTYPNFQKIAFLIVQERNLGAVNAILMWFKTLKYVGVSKNLSFLQRVLVQSALDIFYFMVS